MPLCQYNPFPLVLGESAARSEIRHLDYRSADEILVAAGEVGSGTGMSLFSPSTSGNNFLLIEFKWEMYITTADWYACGIKLAPFPSDYAVLLACSFQSQIAFLYIDLNLRVVES